MMVKMIKTGIERMLQSKEVPKAVLDHLKPHLNESRSLLMTLVLLVTFTLSVLVLAACFTWLRRNMERPMFEGEESGDGKQDVSLGTKVRKSINKVRKFMSGWSDIELQRLLQSSSSVPGLIFTLVGFVAIYATDGDLARLLMGLVGLGSQVVFLTWIYVESWGEFLNSFILTGSLVTAAYSTLSPAKCRSLECLESEHSWEPTLIRSTFYFILASSLLHVFLAAAALLGILKLHPDVLMNRIYSTLDDQLSYTVDDKVLKSHLEKRKYVSKSLLGELVEWCFGPEYVGEMKEKVYRGLLRTKLRVVLSAIPTLVLAASAIYLSRNSWRWAGAAAVALQVASCSAMLLGFFCATQREHRLPLCFSRGIDIIESFENASSDLFGMKRMEYDQIKDALFYDFESVDYDLLSKSFATGIDWQTCNYMVIQTLGLAELGHFELHREKEEDPNSNEALRELETLSKDVKGLEDRRRRILDALEKRDPVKIGPTAISKIAGVMMAMHNAIEYMKKQENGHSTV